MKKFVSAHVASVAAVALLKLVECKEKKIRSAKYLGALYGCSYRTIIRRATQISKEMFARKMKRHELIDSEKWWRTRLENDENAELTEWLTAF